MNAQKLGTATLTENTQVGNRYEVAAWYQDLALEAGVTTDWTKDSNFTYYGHGVEGVVTASDFTSLYGGVRVGTGKIDKDKGQRATWQGVQTYLFFILADWEPGARSYQCGNWLLTLADSLEVVADAEGHKRIVARAVDSVAAQAPAPQPGN